MILVLENTLYSILVYLLLDKGENKVYFILEGDKIEKEMLEKLNKYFYKAENYKLGHNQSSVIIKYICYWLELIYLFFKFKILKKRYSIDRIYGNDNLAIYLPFKNKKIYLLEDGMINYNQSNWERKWWLFLKGLSNKYIPYGKEENVSRIYLTGLFDVPNEIYYKVKFINLKKMWNKKSLEEQNKILDIFSIDLNLKNKLLGRDIILFTQPLSEDKYITEQEKIEIYSKIIKKYPKDRLIIKTHPREKTLYKNYFCEYLVLDKIFPFEILNLLDIKFKKAVTIMSTAALSLNKETEVDWYGTECYPKLFEKIGSLEHIKKTNCYLNNKNMEE